ncbi:cobalamin biosynthesis protein [Streptomyces sp. UNOB3_S3]|uniref:cobalamin biosynthesis protein n=1 Tax=Streptomyces sp. UNOB3_S3 TaxID=2871682 RepID=UPI001E4BD5C7|nr:cobalamin biosynthesis protein [Streptomyces sp. UNOB3_S3]MCC3777078.1 cobalamin biosynthesis protein [Streptomyces sp. UNOB3_S3]
MSGTLHIGVGACRGVSPEEVISLVERTLREAGADGAAIAALVTAEVKADEPGLLAAAHHLGVPLTSYGPAALAAQPVPHPSEAARRATGAPGVAEAAALLSAGPGGVLLVGKRKSARATCAIACTV